MNVGDIGPLRRLVLESTQWITGMYKSGIMNLLDIPYFGHVKNVGLCIKKLFVEVHGGIIWMDKPVQVNVALISKITGFPTINVPPEDLLENKVCEKELEEQVKAQFSMTKGNRGIIIKYMNENVTIFSSIMSCKLLRKICIEEAATGLIML
jgi:hypothetical protein